MRLLRTPVSESTSSSLRSSNYSNTSTRYAMKKSSATNTLKEQLFSSSPDEAIMRLQRSLDSIGFSVFLAQVESDMYPAHVVASRWGHGLKTWHITLIRQRHTHQIRRLNEEWSSLKAKTPLMLIHGRSKPKAEVGTLKLSSTKL